MRIYIANLGKYNEGVTIGNWFTLPIDFEELKECIGLNDEYEEYIILDYELPFQIGEYEAIDYINYLCELVEKLPKDIREELSELSSYFGSIEELCEHQEDILHYPDCKDMTDVARCFIEEIGVLGEIPMSLRNYIDYEAYGRDLEMEGNFIVTAHGMFEIIC